MPFGAMMPEPVFSAEVGTSMMVAPFAGTEKLVLHPVSGMLTVPVVALRVRICRRKVCAPNPFCMNPVQNRVPRVGTMVAVWACAAVDRSTAKSGMHQRIERMIPVIRAT